MENKISTFKKEKYDIITFVERKFGFYLSLDFETYADTDVPELLLISNDPVCRILQ